MPWILFDEEDHRIPAPRFCLESLQEGRICAEQYNEERQLVLVFTHDGDCQACLEMLRFFAAHVKEYAAVDAQILALIPEEAGELEKVPGLAELPFPLLADPDGKVRALYAGLMDESLVDEDDLLLYVLDIYGAPYSAYVSAEKDLNQGALHGEVLSWLEYIGMQCPE